MAVLGVSPQWQHSLNRSLVRVDRSLCLISSLWQHANSCGTVSRQVESWTRVASYLPKFAKMAAHCQRVPIPFCVRSCEPYHSGPCAVGRSLICCAALRRSHAARIRACEALMKNTSEKCCCPLVRKRQLAPLHRGALPCVSQSAPKAGRGSAVS